MTGNIALFTKRIEPLELLKDKLTMDIERCRTVTEDDVHALKKEFYDVKV
jgi:hypothetical protein